MIGIPSRRMVVSLFIFALLAVTLAGAGGQRPGTSTFTKTERTDAGDWYGTWVYKSRQQRIVMWIQDDGTGKPEYRLQYQSLSSPEIFTTDWKGQADYTVVGTEAVFKLVANRRDGDTISGTLEWNLQFEKTGRSRMGEFEMYRGDDGRQLVLHFFNQTLTIRKDKNVASDQTPSAWTFVKNSKRLVRWEEIF